MKAWTPHQNHECVIGRALGQMLLINGPDVASRSPWLSARLCLSHELSHC